MVPSFARRGDVHHAAIRSAATAAPRGSRDGAGAAAGPPGGGSDTTKRSEHLGARVGTGAAIDGTEGQDGGPATGVAARFEVVGHDRSAGTGRSAEPPPFAPVEKPPRDPAVCARYAGAGSFGTDPEFGVVDARVTFLGEVARFQNVLGVYDVDNRLGDVSSTPRIVLPRIEQAEADPAFPLERPGGGPLAAGDSVPLSDFLALPWGLDDGDHLFRIAAGAVRNDPRLFDPSRGTLRFESADGGPATLHDGEPPRLVFSDAVTGERIPVEGEVFHATAGQRLDPDGADQVPAVPDPVVPESALVDLAVTLFFEDERLAASDHDFNDLVIRVEEFVAHREFDRAGPDSAAEPETIRIEPGSGRTKLADLRPGREVLDLSAFGLDLAALDTSGDGAVGRGDAFVRAGEHPLRIDLGAAAAEAPGLDVLVIGGHGEPRPGGLRPSRRRGLPTGRPTPTVPPGRA